MSVYFMFMLTSVGHTMLFVDFLLFRFNLLLSSYSFTLFLFYISFYFIFHSLYILQYIFLFVIGLMDSWPIAKYNIYSVNYCL